MTDWEIVRFEPYIQSVNSSISQSVNQKSIRNQSKTKMGLFEFLMLFCFGFSWPFSIAKSLRSKSAKGKSIMFMMLVELGYVFGIVHKLLNDCNWVIWMYVALFFVVAVDIALYFRNRRYDRAAEAR